MVEEQTVEVRKEPPLFGRLGWYRRRVESLEQRAAIDELTGLRNQGSLWRELSRRSRSCSPEAPLAIVMVDFDLFKQVNEAYGHIVGDAVLRRGAAVLKNAAPSPRLAFRYGGEEFVVLAEGTEEDARELAESIRAEVALQNGALPAVTVSCGVAALHNPAEPWIALDRADAALRDAKRSGRNRVAVAGSTAPGERVMLVEELEHDTACRAAVALAVATMQVRDRHVADHSDDVVTLCEAIGRRLDFDDRALQHLTAGAQLHDVGKVAVPSSILNKPGPLTEDEWSVIREHTITGERILRSVPEMSEVATIVRHSHEHWDGSGYPDGLTGEDIPLASRVILCADAFHAIRSDRPYRSGRPAGDAIAELRACAGTQLDPAVVEALVAVAGAARTVGAPGVVSARKKRLVVLLTTLVIGGGSAVAGISEVRDAFRSLFGATVAPSDAASDHAVPEGFGLGPLGDLLSLEQGADRVGSYDTRAPSAESARDRSKRGKATRGDDRRRGAGSGSDRSTRKAALQGTGGVGGPGGSGLQNTTPRTPAPGPGPSDPAPTGNRGPAPSPSPDTHPRSGRALGQSQPTPRRPAQAGPQRGGRTDPPALGRSKGHSR